MIFKQLETDVDNRLSFPEFKAALPHLKKWGVQITNPKETFEEMDEDKGGFLSFDEFCHFCIVQSLHSEDKDLNEEKIQPPARKR